MEKVPRTGWRDADGGERERLRPGAHDPKSSLPILDNVLRLVRDAPERQADPASAAERLNDRDCLKTFNLVGQAAGMIRAAESRVQELKVHNEALIEQLKAADARAAAAEARAMAAEVRAQQAEERASKAQEWLKRIHDSLEQLAVARLQRP
jgi:hypothetical protein